MKNKNQPYDIIGDIHGHADTLRELLAKLGYEERDGAYRHPERVAIFLGDFIDRGPKIRETLQIVRAMTDAGTALAVMGNHEYNALCYHTPDGRGGYLRSRTAGDGKNVKQHRATLDQIAEPAPAEWDEWLAWFKTLPLFIDLGELRIVHACWDDQQIAFLNGGSRLTDKLLIKSSTKRTREYRAIDVLLKGKEIRLPDGHTFTDKGGLVRRDIRVKWWLGGEGHTYRSLCMPECATVPKIPVPATKGTARGYAASEPPVIMGHYWLPPERPEPLAPNVACVDYSVAKEGGMLVAYRWDGERVLDAAKFVQVPRVDTEREPSVAETAEDNSWLRKSLTRADRDIIIALENAIDDPATPAEKREQFREELGSVAMGYIDILPPEMQREFLAERDPRDLLTDAEWEAFSNRPRTK